MVLLLASLARSADVLPAPNPFAGDPPPPSMLELLRVGRAVPEGVAAPVPLDAAQRARAERVIAAARRYLGEPYRWGGRGTERLPGWDCLGILFVPFAEVTGTSWRDYDVNPSELVAGGRLGVPVPGVDRVLRAEVPVANLMPGDVLYFLVAGFAIPDAPLLVREGQEYWPWHTGLHVGEGQVLHAEPGGEVRLQPLEDLRFDALLATRLR